MELKIIKDTKDTLLVSMENQTIAEILRVYLNEEDSVELAAWKRDNPDKPLVFEIRTKGKSPRKALEEAISKIEKETSKILEEFKKAVK